MAPAASRALIMAATIVPLVGLALGSAGGAANSAGHAAVLVAVAMAWLVHRRLPDSGVAPALAWSSAAISVSLVNDVLAASWYTDDPLPLAGVCRHLWAGLWPINVAGLFALLLVFPDGGRRGRYWTFLPLAYAAAMAAMVFSMWDQRQSGGEVVGHQSSLQSMAGLVAVLLLAVCLVSAVVSVVQRYRCGDERRALQIRYLLLAGAAAVALLIGGWLAESMGANLEVAYTPFLLAIVVLVPAAVAVAMVRHDLFDVDKVLGSAGSWLLTLVVSAAVFGGVVMTISRSLGASAGLGPAGAAFVTALVLLPLHRFSVALVGRVIDRDRHVAVAHVEQFAADVRAGLQQPESVERVLREAQGDPDLELVLWHPDGRWVRLCGESVDPPDGIDVQVGGVVIAVVKLGWNSARARGALRSSPVPRGSPLR